MKCKVLFSAAIAMVALAAHTAQATTFFVDQFNYADGELTINDGTGDDVSGGLWVPHSGETFDDNIDVISGQAELLNSGSEDANRAAGTAINAGETWYYAALVTVNDTRQDPMNESINNDYFMHFKDGGFGFRGRAYLDDPNVAASDKFTFGLSATSGGQVAKWVTDLDFGTQYKIVVSYAVDTGETNLWVDPVDINSTSISDTNAGGAFTLVDSLGLRQDFLGGTPNNQILIDAVAIGDEFGDVFRDVMIPEPATAMLAAFGLIGLAVTRRRVA